MTIFCSFHPKDPAHFQCFTCQSALCDICISARESNGFAGRETSYFCPGCNTPVELIGIGNIIEPFWKKMSSFFLYPLRPLPLLFILTLSLLATLFHQSFLVQMIVWAIMMKFAYAVLITTSQGSLKPPDMSWGLLNNNLGQVFKQILIFLPVGICSVFVYRLAGPYALFVFLGFLALFAPVILMLLVVTNSILNALNPFLFVPIVNRIGWPYLLMYLFLLLLCTAPPALFNLLPSELPTEFTRFITHLFGKYYTIISFYLMGYVLLQYHREIGYEVDYGHFMANLPTDKKRKIPSRKEHLQNTMAVFIKAGRYQEALKLLRPHIDVESPDSDLSEKYLQLLKLAGEHQKIKVYSGMHLGNLVKTSKISKALALYQDMRENNIPLSSASDLLTIAKWYGQRNEYKNASAAYITFTKSFKGHPEMPRAYLEIARLLHERGNNSSKAQKILQTIIRSYPQHPCAAQAQAYMGSIA